MELRSRDSAPECQICCHPYGPRRSPKRLACGHTCCCTCLAQMRDAGDAGNALRCPWCRRVTTLPAGRSVTLLPDDPDVIAAIAMPTPSHMPVFIRLPSNDRSVPPTPVAKATLGEMGVAVVVVPEGDGEGEGRGDRGKGVAWSGVCTVMLAACLLLFLLIIVMHNMSCVSKRFAVISCG
ncbi:E3 ubiquitin-protein ligase RNF152-like [Megalops cyprinoides]|uniref:E3 ubiquitin-protein ligase RNF152-like n=1 Tax=Megalops cyprinoides TaxID=118141 RepID=UPI00186442A0|nr:E3 ubiquitin-protein ligase RNF152-like [Megalops cyprinoides]